MTDLVLTVQGSARAELAPERATVRFTIAADGPDRAPVIAAVTSALGTVNDMLSGRSTEGAIEAWSVDQISVSAQRPWTNDGSQAALVHRASASGRVLLTSPDHAADLVDSLATDSLVTIDGLEWSLTDSSHERAHAEVRTRAVGDARAKATVLAAATGHSSVDAVALADPGMLDGSSTGMGPQPRFEKAMAMAMDAGGAGGFSLRPQ
ncbi:MAG: hypothetical protein RLZZ608_1637, partial [Actinomycetota bacterium]